MAAATSKATSAVTTCEEGAAGLCKSGSGAAVYPPFAEAVLWAVTLLPEHCDGQVLEGCEWNHLPDTWRYVWNNLRLAIQHASTSHKAAIGDEILQQIAVGHNFMEQMGNDPGMWYTNWHAAAPSAREILKVLTPWLQAYQGSPLRVPRANTGVRFPPSAGRSLQISTDGDVAAAATLANGVELPILGFGVWQLPTDGTTYQSVLWALQAGYRHIDTAQAYQNEHEVGAAIRDSGVPREEIRLVTKLSQPQEYVVARQRFEQQLKILGVDYVDVYMLHSPGGSREDRETAWRQLEALYDEGRIRALGVSNFGIDLLEELWSFARIKPVYLQNKYSIYQPGHYEEASSSESLMSWLASHNMVMTGYSIIHPEHAGLLSPLEDPHVRAIARRVGRTPSQVLHRWLLQLGAVVIPRSRRQERIIENSQLFDFSLSDADIRLLNGIASLVKSTPSARTPVWCEDVYGVELLR